MSAGLTGRLTAEAARTRRESKRAAAAHLDAERALAEHTKTERLAQLTDLHPDGCPSEALAARWEPIATRLREMFADVETHGSTWRVWIEPIHPHRVENGIWVLAVPPRQLGWVRQRFGRLLGSVCGQVEIVACGCPVGAKAA